PDGPGTDRGYVVRARDQVEDVGATTLDGTVRSRIVDLGSAAAAGDLGELLGRNRSHATIGSMRHAIARVREALDLTSPGVSQGYQTSHAVSTRPGFQAVARSARFFAEHVDPNGVRSSPA